MNQTFEKAHQDFITAKATLDAAFDDLGTKTGWPWRNKAQARVDAAGEVFRKVSTAFATTRATTLEHAMARALALFDLADEDAKGDLLLIIADLKSVADASRGH